MSFPRDVMPGEPASSRWANEVARAARGFSPRVGADAGRLLQTTQVRIVVRNNTGAALKRGTVVGLGEALFPVDGDTLIAVEGEIPTAEHSGRFAVLLWPCPAETLTEAVIQGPARVRVDPAEDLTVIAGDRLGIKSGEVGYLEKNSQGPALVLDVKTVSPPVEDDPETEDENESDPGERWAIVNIGSASGPMPFFVVTNDGPVTNVSHPDGLRACPASRGTGGGWEIDRDAEQTVFASFVGGVFFGGINPPEEEPEEGDPEPPAPTLGDLVLVQSIGGRQEITDPAGGVLLTGGELLVADGEGPRAKFTVHGVDYTIHFETAGFPGPMLETPGALVTLAWAWNQGQFVLIDIGCPPGGEE